MFRLNRKLILIIAVLAAILAALFAPLLTYREVSSPDGGFTVIAKTAMADALIPMMPGAGGDKPGRIIVIRKDGRSCGSARAEMVSMIADLRWRLEATPREAEIVGVARWNLDACTVELEDH